MINSRERRWLERVWLGGVVADSDPESLGDEAASSRNTIDSAHSAVIEAAASGRGLLQPSQCLECMALLGFQLMSGARQTWAAPRLANSQQEHNGQWRASPSKITNSSACVVAIPMRGTIALHARRARPRTRSIGKNSAWRASRQVRLGKTGAWRSKRKLTSYRRNSREGRQRRSGYIRSIGQ